MVPMDATLVAILRHLQEVPTQAAALQADTARGLHMADFLQQVQSQD